MSNRRYELDISGKNNIRGSAKLLNVASAKYGGDWHSLPHTHGYAELFYIVGGDGQFRIEDQLHSVQENQLVIVSPNVMHTEVSYEAHPLEYIVLGVEGLELSVVKNRDRRFCILDYRGSGDVLTCMRNIFREMEAQQPGYEVICQAYMDILITRLMRSTNFSLSSSAAPSSSRQCAVIRHYIDTHYKEQLNLDQLAEVAHVNKFYLAHAFKEEYGLSPHQLSDLPAPRRKPVSPAGNGYVPVPDCPGAGLFLRQLLLPELPSGRRHLPHGIPKIPGRQTVKKLRFHGTGAFRLSKKLSESWAFSIIHDIMILVMKKCWNEEKWNEEYLKS